MRLTLTFLITLLLLLPASGQEIVAIPGNSPLINLRIQFDVGSIDDPEGMEGLSYLTAFLLSKGSSEAYSYQDILEMFYPWAVSLGTTVDKERITYSATVHRDHLEEFTPILVEILTRPAFTVSDVERIKDRARNYLTQDLRTNNDEELGKEVLYLALYPNSHPYGHHSAGTLSGIDAAGPEEIRAFYQDRFSAENVIIGVAGGYPERYPEELASVLKENLPSADNAPERVSIAEPVAPDGRRVTIVEKDTRSVAMSMGLPIEVNRSHPDWVALALFNSFLGEHRSSNSYLYQKLREQRGLNYGDYSYIEYFPDGMFLTQPSPNYPRQSQIFQIWIRPVQPEHTLFALRATLYELERVVREGLTEEEFEATRSFLRKNAPLLVANSSYNLGYELDSHAYGTAPFVSMLTEGLKDLTLEEVNAAISRHIDPFNMEIVLIAKSANDLRDKLLAGETSPMTYNSPKPDSVLREDRVIEDYPIRLNEVSIKPVRSFFR